MRQRTNDGQALLSGRHSECMTLDGLLAGARAGQSQVLVVRGEAGIGKSALLDYLEANAAGCRIARSAGAEAEMELAYAGLHQLCGPFLDRLDRLPDPQRTALSIAFGLIGGDAPDRSDQVVPLSAHPNDPPQSGGVTAMEFLTTFEVTFPDSASEQEVADMKAREADRTRELAERGHLVRLWMLPPTPGSSRALGLWRAADGQELQAMLKSLPMDEWMTTEATPLTEHPNDPAKSEM